MSQSVVEMTKDLVLAQIRSGTLVPEEMQEALRHIFERLMVLKSREEAAPSVAPVIETPQAPADWRTSITEHTITCLECGAVFKQLSGRHLRGHGLDAHSYRAKYGIPSTQPLAARETAAKQREMLQRIRPWELRRT
jgi:predicted transcriptional regulator